MLRVVDGDEKPALPKISAAMEHAKKIKTSLENKPILLEKVIAKINERWKNQMGQALYGAGLFLNPGKYFDILEADDAYASRLRAEFNDVLERLVTDRDLRDKISDSIDNYQHLRGGFASEMAKEHRKSKSPLVWWEAYGGRDHELQKFARKIVSLCCSSSGCERNWSTFEFIHSKKRNRLEHKRLNDLVYVQYNRKIEARFKKRRELGRNFDPLVLEDLKWSNEWIDANREGESDPYELEDFTQHRVFTDDINTITTYSRRRPSSSNQLIQDDEEVEDDYGLTSSNTTESEIIARDEDGNTFELDDLYIVILLLYKA